MKKLFYIAGALAFLASCNESKTMNTVKISGKITNPNNDFVYFQNETKADTFYLNEDNEFAAEFKLNEASYYVFADGNESSKMFLTPGDDLQMSLDTKEFDETIKYEGQGAVNCNYMAEKYLFEEQNNIQHLDYELYKLDKTDFLNKVDSLLELKTRLISKKENHPEISEKLIRLEKIDPLYGWALNLNSYKQYHAYMNKVKMEDVDGDFSEQLDKLELENETYLGIYNYNEYIRRYSWKTSKKDSSYIDHPLHYRIWVLLGIDENFKNDKIRNHLFYISTKEVLEHDGVNYFEGVHKVFDSLCKDDALKTSLNELYKEYESMKAGNPSPIFTGEDINGNRISLGDLKGKYVYVDVWATWCGPCKGEIPHLAKLEEEYHDRNIAFVSLSVDTDKDAWAKMVQDKEMKGHQVFADNNWQNPFVAGYKIKGVPTFVLIDPQGNIVDANAPRPSGAIKDLLEKQQGL